MRSRSAATRRGKASHRKARTTTNAASPKTFFPRETLAPLRHVAPTLPSMRSSAARPSSWIVTSAATSRFSLRYRANLSTMRVAERSEVGAPGVGFTPGFSAFLTWPRFVPRHLPHNRTPSPLKCAVVAPRLVAEKHSIAKLAQPPIQPARLTQFIPIVPKQIRSGRASILFPQFSRRFTAREFWSHRAFWTLP
jgi:hypothetical protein